MRHKDSPTSPDRVETVVGKSTTVTGTIVASGAVRVEGRVDGGIEADGDVFVVEKAVVEADISGRHVVVAGVVRGNVRATARLELAATAKLFGDFEAPAFMVSDGASFEGRSHMSGEATQSDAPPAPE